MPSESNPFDFQRLNRLQEKVEDVELWKKPPPKITFYCPKCKTALVVDADQAGTKSDCPVCGQRLEAPRPAPNKTVLGSLDPPPAPSKMVILAPHEERREEGRPVRPRDDPAERMATLAVIFAAISVVIAGFPLGIIAAILATISLTMPSRQGRGTAITALTMGIIAAFVHAIFILFMLASMPRH